MNADHFYFFYEEMSSENFLHIFKLNYLPAVLLIAVAFLYILDIVLFF